MLASHRTIRFFASIGTITLSMYALTPWAQAAQATNTTLVLSAAGKATNTVAAGTVVTLTATVTVAGHPLTRGQVELCAAKTPRCTDIHLLGTAQLTLAGSASLRLRPGVGRSSYRAIFLPSAGHAGSISGASAIDTLAAAGSAFANTATTLSSAGSLGNYQLQAKVTATGVAATPPSTSVSFWYTTDNTAAVTKAVLGPSLQGLTFHLASEQAATDDSAQGLVTADFNGDGIPDLAKIDDPYVIIRLGNGDGTFTTLPAGPAMGRVAIVVADFNGDGTMDLAVADLEYDVINLLLGEGDGTFKAASSTATGEGPFIMAVGDYNKDGNEDLCVLDLDGTLTILLGKGDGTFTTAPAPQVFLTSPAALTTGDFNHDGHLDLAIVDDGSGSNLDPPFVHILLGTGDGGFETDAGVGLAVSLDPYSPNSIVPADFNGDGNLDLVAAGGNTDGTFMCTLLGDGKGGFAEPAKCQPVGGDQIALADLNADGLPDLAVGVYGSGVEAFLGKGDGTLSSPVFFETGEASQYLAAADYDGDGLSDVAVANADASVSILTAEFTETATATAPSLTLVGTGTHPIYATYPGTATTGRSVSRILDLQGVAATTTTLVVSSHAQPVAMVHSDTVVTLTAKVAGETTAAGQVAFCDATASNCLGLHLLGISQLSPGGTATMSFVPGIGSHSYKAVFLLDANGAGSASSAQPLTVTGEYLTSTTMVANKISGHYTLTATVTGKPDLDLPVSGTVSFVDTSNANHLLGTATLTPATRDVTFIVGSATGTGKSPVDVVTADFNGDGIADAAVLNADEDSLTLLLGEGNGPVHAVPVPYTADSPHGIAVGDWNGDGKPDLALTNDGNRFLTILNGKGDGAFVSTQTELPGTGPYLIAAADFNGDGLDDLAVTDRGKNVVYILPGHGDGTFGPARGVSTGAGPYGITVADFNGDHRADLAVVNSQAQTVTILLGKGDGTFSSGFLAAGDQPQLVVSGDFNGDGKIDLAISDYGSDSLMILLGAGDGTFLAAPSPRTGIGPFGMAVGDVNQDGKTDLVVVNHGDQTVTVLVGNGDGTFTSSHTLAPAGAGIFNLALADFDGDGVPDLILPNVGNESATVLLTRILQGSEAILSNVGDLSSGVHAVEAVYPGSPPYLSSRSATQGIGDGK